MTDFFRFPHTHHLIWLGEGEPRGDKVLLPHEVTEMLREEIIVEEKLDGANLGISLDENGELRAQNRGSYLEVPFTGQFSRLNSWLGQYGHIFKSHLTPDLILFGEWCAAQHSLDYHALPDWFLLFDVYDRNQGAFWSIARRDGLALELGIALVPELTRGHFDQIKLTEFLQQTSSRYRPGQVEGIIIRRDSDKWNEARAKFVNKDFVQAIDEHWRSRTIQWNQVSQNNEWER